MKQFARLLLITFAMSVLLTFRSSAEAAQPTIPPIEKWQGSIYPFANANMGHPTKILVTWHQDPRGEGYEGSVLSYQGPENKVIPFSKSWNFRKVDGEYEWSGIRVALLLENGEWVVGNMGEMLNVKQGRNEKGEITSVTYEFNGGHKSISRTIKFE